jgi:tRNA threonylcarbamoyladenosine biosynthesis protein TsaE
MTETIICETPEDTYNLGNGIGSGLKPSDVVLLTGGLGAGKTLLTKGILDALGFDVDEVTSPSFTLVNLYKVPTANVYHIDLWRIEEGSGAAFGVGLNEILEDPKAIVVIEWAEKLGKYDFPGRVFHITIEGDADDPRRISFFTDKSRGFDLP